MMTKVYICVGLAFFLGFILGLMFWRRIVDIAFTTGKILKVLKRDGVFVVNTTNPDTDVFSLEIECPLGDIPQKKMLIFEIRNISSQEKPFA